MTEEAQKPESPKWKQCWTLISKHLHQFWEPQTAPEQQKTIPFLAVVAFVFVILALRRYDALTTPQFWAEDGAIFFKQQAEIGFPRSLFVHHAGYMHLAPRLGAMILSPVPLRWLPFVYNFSALLAAAFILAWFVRDEYRLLLPSFRLRLAVCILTTCAPTGREIIANQVNLQWYLLWYAVLLFIAPVPVSRRGRIGTVSAWWLIGLSSPAAISFIPLWMVRALIRKKERWICLLCILPSILLAVDVDPSDVGTTTEPVAAAWLMATGCIEIFAWRVAAELFLGEDPPNALLESLGVMLAVFGTAAVVFAWVYAIKSGDAKQRTGLALAVAILGSLMFITLLGRPELIRQVALYRMGWGGGRYFFVPVCIMILGFIAALSISQKWRRGIVVALIAIISAGMLRSFRVEPMENLDWPRRAAELSAAVDEKKTAVIEFPVNPTWWPERNVRIRFVEGKAVPGNSVEGQKNRGAEK